PQSHPYSFPPRRSSYLLGLFAYFLAMPLLYAETIDCNIRDSVYNTVGWRLLLVLIGFEGGYQLKKLLWRHSRRAHGYVQLKCREDGRSTRLKSRHDKIS